MRGSVARWLRRFGWRAPGRAPLGLLALAFALYTLRFGYRFGAGDHDELIPSALALLSGGHLFARDWLVQTVLDGVTVRTAFVWGLAMAGRGMPLEAAVAALHVAVWMATAAGTYALGWTLARSRLAAALGTALALLVTVAFPIGANALVANLLTPEGVAWTLLVPALALWLRGRPAGAGVLIGLAAWFHLLAAALVGLWLGAAALGRWTARTPGAGPRPVLWLAAPAVVLALPVLVPVALDQAAGGADPAGPSALYVHAVFRNPWHHLFFSFPAGQQVRFWTLMTLGVVSAVALARRNRLAHAADVGRLWGLAAVAGLLAVLFVEAWPVEAVAKLQLFKLAVPSALLATLCVSTWLADRIPEAWRARGRAWWTAHGTAASALTTVAVVAVLAVGAMGHGPYTTRFEPLTHPATPMGRVEAWARTATPEGALFAVPPSASTFRSRARRAVVITWNGFIFGDREMQTWYRRLQSVAPIAPPPRGSDPREALDASYAARAPAAWEALRAAYGIDFAVVPDSVRLPYPVAFQTDGWHVVRVTPAAP